MTPLERQNRIEELGRQISHLSAERAALKQEILNEKSPFKLGDIITWRGRIGKVISITDWVCDDPCWYVQIIRKDGSYGAEYKVYPYLNPVKCDSK